MLPQSDDLFDTNGPFLYEALQASGKLSVGICDDIRKLFADEQALLKFIRANVDIDDLDAWDLIDQVFPEPCDTDIKWTDVEGLPRLNARAFM